MTEHCGNTWMSRVARSSEKRATYSPPCIERQKLPEIVCGGTGRLDDIQSTFNETEDPPPGVQP